MSQDIKTCDEVVIKMILTANRSSKSIIFVAILLMSVITISTSGTQFADNSEYTEFNPIDITGDSAFDTFVSNNNNLINGTGTRSDPYIISYLNISDNSQVLISLTDISYNISLQHNYLDGLDNSFNALMIDNVSIVDISYNIITNFDTINVQDNDNMEIMSNMITGGSDGFYLSSTDHITIRSNNLTDTGNGFVISTSQYANIQDNIFVKIYGTSFGTFTGLSFSEVEHIHVHNNSFSDIEDDAMQIIGDFSGLTDPEDTNVTVTENFINGTGTIGITIRWMVDILIQDNEIYQTGTEGILGSNADQLNIVNNVIQNPSSDGIDFTESETVNITGNNIQNVGGYGIYTSQTIKYKIQDNIINRTGRDGMYLRLGQQFPETNVSGNELYNIVEHGMLIYFTHNMTIHNNLINIISPNYAGIFFRQSGNATITDNQINTGGLVISASIGLEAQFDLNTLGQAIQAEVSGNSVGGKPIVFYQKEENLDLDETDFPGGIGQLLVVNSSNIEITGLSFTNVHAAIATHFSTDIMISHNTFSGTGRSAIEASSSSQLEISDNLVTSTTGGIILYNIVDADITQNQITNFGERADEDNREESGIMIFSADQVNIANNSIRNGAGNGISTSETTGIRISRNRIVNIATIGIAIEKADHSIIGYNYLRNINGDAIGYASDSFEGADPGLNITLEHNVIIDTGTGISIPSLGSSVIENNTITDVLLYGIYLRDPDSIDITYNHIQGGERNSIYLFYPQFVNITKNRLETNRSTFLFYQEGDAITAGTTILKENDFLGNRNQTSALAFSETDFEVQGNYWSNHDSGDYNLAGHGIDQKPSSTLNTKEYKYTITSSGDVSTDDNANGIIIQFKTNFIGEYSIYVNNVLKRTGLATVNEPVDYNFTGNDNGSHTITFLAVAPDGKTLQSTSVVTIGSGEGSSTETETSVVTEKTVTSTYEETTITETPTNSTNNSQISGNNPNYILPIALSLIFVSPIILGILSRR